jgi:ligand-binding SRPBCC domain-containing protein
MYLLTCQMKAPVPIARAFAFFESPYNLARITPAWLRFRITTPGQVTIRKGAEIEYQIRWLGAPVSWKTVFTNYAPPLLFEDEQAQGPYAFWRHRHTFEAAEDGTIISDHVEYALPFGALGRLAHRLVVARQLRAIFEYRQRALIPLLGGEPGKYRFSPVDITAM